MLLGMDVRTLRGLKPPGWGISIERPVGPRPAAKFGSRPLPGRVRGRADPGGPPPAAGAPYRRRAMVSSRARDRAVLVSPAGNADGKSQCVLCLGMNATRPAWA